MHFYCFKILDFQGKDIQYRVFRARETSSISFLRTIWIYSNLFAWSINLYEFAVWHFWGFVKVYKTPKDHLVLWAVEYENWCDEWFDPSPKNYHSVFCLLFYILFFGVMTFYVNMKVIKISELFAKTTKPGKIYFLSYDPKWMQDATSHNGDKVWNWILYVARHRNNKFDHWFQVSVVRYVQAYAKFVQIMSQLHLKNELIYKFIFLVFG